MKMTLKVSIFAVAALAVAFPVLADQTADVKSGGPDYSQQNSMTGMEYGNQNPSQMKADNTALNARDRDRTSMTPLDQGNSQEDIDATAAIRKDIMERKGMSVDAQNVKIITSYGKVTLRGPVKTAEEKNFIAETARGRFGPKNVDNQIEVIGNIQPN